MADYPPGYGPMPQAPGMLGATMMASGLGAPYGQYHSNRQMGMDVGAARFGGSAAQMIGGGIAGGVGLASATGYLMGEPLATGARTAGGKALGMAWRGLDPFWHASKAYGVGSGFMSGLGMGGAGAMAGGLVAGGGVLAAGMLAIEGVRSVGRNMAAGAANYTTATAMGRQTGLSSSNQNLQGFSQNFSKDLRGVAQDLGAGVDEIASLTRDLMAIDNFQTATSLKEFRKQFKQTMETVKEISQAAQTSIQEATQIYAQVRQQGFYTPGAQTGQALDLKGVSRSTGIGLGRVSGMASYGAQSARSRGLRGRFGAQVGTRAIGDVGRLMQTGGAQAEELIMEMGGVEAASGQLTDSILRFSGTSRGRAMIAASMGAGGSIDPRALSSLGAGNVQNLVNSASNRGLGTMVAAGSRESRQNLLEYGGLPMLQMAMMQQRELGQDPTRAGTVKMLGTMGLNRDMAELLLQTTAATPATRTREAEKKQTALNRAAYEKYGRQTSIVGRTTGAYNRFLANPAQDLGATISMAAGGFYTDTVNALTGYQETRGGLEEEARLARRSGSLRRPTETFNDDLNDSWAFTAEGKRDRAARASLYAAGINPMSEGAGATYRDAGKKMEGLTSEQMRRLDYANRVDQLPGMFSGITAGTDQAMVQTLEIGKRIGLLRSSMTLDEYKGLSDTERMRHRNKIAEGLVEIGRDDVADAIGGPGTSESGLRTGIRDKRLGAVKGRAGSVAVDLFSGGGGQKASLLGLAIGGANYMGMKNMNARRAAMQTLQGGGKEGNRFEQLSSMLLSDSETTRAKALRMAAEEYGESDPLYDALVGLAKRTEGMSKKERSGLRKEMKQKGLGSLALDQQYALNLSDQSQRESTNAERLLNDGNEVAKQMRGQLESLKDSQLSEGFGAASYDDRKGAITDIFSEVIKGGVEDDERAFIGELFNDGGSKVLSLTESIGKGTSEEEVLEMLRGQGVDGKRAGSIAKSVGAAGDAASKREAFIRGLSSENLIDPADWGSDVTGNVVTGVEAEKQVLIEQQKLVTAIQTLLKENPWLAKE